MGCIGGMGAIPVRAVGGSASGMTHVVVGEGPDSEEGVTPQATDFSTSVMPLMTSSA